MFYIPALQQSEGPQESQEFQMMLAFANVVAQHNQSMAFMEAAQAQLLAHAQPLGGETARARRHPCAKCPNLPAFTSAYNLRRHITEKHELNPDTPQYRYFVQPNTYVQILITQ